MKILTLKSCIKGMAYQSAGASLEGRKARVLAYWVIGDV